MKWYRQVKTADSNPPAYLVERIGDLQYASSLTTRSNRQAREVLLAIAVQFDNHQDKEYADAARKAAQVVLDSPAKAKSLIVSLIRRMNFEKEEHEGN